MTRELKELQSLTKGHGVKVSKSLLKHAHKVLKPNEEILFICKQRGYSITGKRHFDSRVMVTDQRLIDGNLPNGIIPLYMISDISWQKQDKKYAYLIFKENHRDTKFEGIDLNGIEKLVSTLERAVSHAEFPNEQIRQQTLNAKRFEEYRYGETRVYVDEEEKEWTADLSKIYSFTDVLNCELVEDNNSITSTQTGNMVKRAVVGKALMGSAGAVVGATTAKKSNIETCQKLSIVVTINDLKTPTKIFNLLTKETPKNDTAYTLAFADAQKLLSLFKIMVKNKTKSEGNSQNDFEQIKAMKELLDLGIITEAEFEQKKKELLNL